MTLILSQLACLRGGRVVFRDLSFTLGDGQAGVLRGPNGVGKSTLLRVLAGMINPMAGDATLADVSLTGDRTAFQEQVAYGGHLDAVKPALTVGQNLALWAGIYGTATTRAARALEFFGLDTLADRPAAQCSAGQKRRLGLARLMVIDRPLWLLDEPTVSLDAASSQLVADLVHQHCAQGGSALIATHIDLGLLDPPVLEMSPPASGPGTAMQDAFLDGDWA